MRRRRKSVDESDAHEASFELTVWFLSRVNFDVIRKSWTLPKFAAAHMAFWNDKSSFESLWSERREIGLYYWMAFLPYVFSCGSLTCLIDGTAKKGQWALRWRHRCCSPHTTHLFLANVTLKWFLSIGQFHCSAECSRHEGSQNNLLGVPTACCS